MPTTRPRYENARPAGSRHLRFGRRLLLETTWTLIGFPIGVAGFVFVVSATATGIGLTITLVGVPLLAATLWLSGWFGHLHRRLVAVFLGTRIADPPRPRSASGFLPWLRIVFTDATNWRAWCYLLLRFPLATFSFCVSVTVWATGFGGLTYPVWYRFITNTEPDGTIRHGSQMGDGVWADTFGWIAVYFLVGMLVLVSSPWIIRGLATLDRWLATALLAPTRSAHRMRDLEVTRAAVVADADVTLRRIERDLHDGTQAELVALAMQLGLAREELAEARTPEAVDSARQRLDLTHTAAKDALRGLRDIVAGIHPAVLDTGLEPALTTLARRSPLPVSLRVDLDERPAPAIESLVYHAVAELLANIARHADATAASVTVMVTNERRLRLEVHDDGIGGATVVDPAPGAVGGTGLAGLRDRIAAVDGTLHVTSPRGGPTIVEIGLPLAVAEPDPDGGQTGA